MAIKSGIVSGIAIKRTYSGTPEKINAGFFREGHGLDGDIRSGPGNRQVCLALKESVDEIRHDKREGLCFFRFRETLQIEGLGADLLQTGTLIGIGASIMKVSPSRKTCRPACSINSSGESCALVKGVYFLQVLRSGLIEKGMSVSLFRPDANYFS